MIDPQHDCSAVTKPEISLDGGILWTEGVGLPILLAAIVRSDIIWFSTVVGGYDDNTRIIATSLLEIRSEMTNTPTIDGEVTRFIGDRYPVTEYELADKMASRFGIRELVNLEMSDFKTEGSWLVASHDEHWSAIIPVGDNELRKVLQGTLGQIGYIIGKPIVSDRVVEGLLQVLGTYSTMRLNATRAATNKGGIIKVEVMLPVRRWSRLQRLVANLGMRPFVSIGRIDISGDVARMVFNRK